MIPNSAIANIRYGLATNSSSSHSIIHNPETLKNNPDNYNTGEFHWDFFTLTSKEAKNNYMMAQLKAAMGYDNHYGYMGLLKGLGFIEAAHTIEEMGVDHESVQSFPKDSQDQINMDFFEDYKNYLVNSDFVILGGNDNSEDDHKLAIEDDGTENYFYTFDSDDRAWRNGNYWVLISQRRKLRISFDGEIPKAKVPELVDLKITDYCNIGCSFCYQDSTTEGKHADIECLQKIVRNMASYKTTIEYAIGGGEPTQHPEFHLLLRGIHNNGHIANFTTRSTLWFKDTQVVNAVKEYVSGIAYSVGSIEEMHKFYKLHHKAFFNKDSRIKQPKFYLHIIPEIMGNDKFRELMAEIDKLNKDAGWRSFNITVTLLGYKQIGRAIVPVEPIPELLDIIVRMEHTAIGIDTKFAQVYKPYLVENKINPKLYTTQEGEFSMYIDAVEEIAYKSSYDLDNPISLVDARGKLLNNVELFEKI